MTLNEFLPEYRRDHIRHLKPETQRLYEDTLARYVLPSLGDHELAALTLRVLRDHFRALESLVAPNTARLAKTILSTVLKEAVLLGHISVNPCPEVRIKGGKVRCRKSLTNDEIRTLLAECDEELQLLLRFAITTGLRISELLGLAWEDVTERGTVRPSRRIYRGRTDDRLKSATSGRERSLGNLPLQRGFGPIFTSTYDSLQKRLVAAAKRAKVYSAGFGFHWFRSRHITAMQAAGASSVEAAYFVGHSNVQLSLRYTESELSRATALVTRLQQDVL